MNGVHANCNTVAEPHLMSAKFFDLFTNCFNKYISSEFLLCEGPMWCLKRGAGGTANHGRQVWNPKDPQKRSIAEVEWNGAATDAWETVTSR